MATINPVEIDVEELLEKHALKVLNTCTNPTNYKILKALPSTITELMQELELTKAPVNTRINSLCGCALVWRELGTGKVYSSELAENFMELIDKVKSSYSCDKIRHIHAVIER